MARGFDARNVCVFQRFTLKVNVCAKEISITVTNLEELLAHTLDSHIDVMPDAWEVRYGLDPNDPSDASSDEDNDGVSAYDEFIAGTIQQ